MRFSVIIPAYNCAKTLEATVRSIQTSGLTDFEIIIIDDGSTDGTAELCERLSVECDGIRSVHQPNSGASAARNRGINEAQGEYIWFIDADDIVRELDMSLISEALSNDADCIMFGMCFVYMHREKTILRETQSCGSSLTLTHENLGMNFRALFDKNYFTAIWNKIIRKRILTDNGLYFNSDLINYEDLHFSLQLMTYCKKAVALPEVYYDYFNEFGHDHTVDRIQRIPDIISYTDKVIAPFYKLNDKLCKDGCLPIEELGETVLRLYMESAFFKLKTSDRKQLKLLCASVQKSEAVNREAHNIVRLSRTDQRLYRWMMNNSFCTIWAFMHYCRLRGIGSRIYRILKCYSGK